MAQYAVHVRTEMPPAEVFITVAADGDGSVVTYDAQLDLNGALRLADPLLRLAFGRIGDRATAGLIEALGGERIDPVPL